MEKFKQSFLTYLSYVPIVGLIMLSATLFVGFSDYQRVALYVFGIGYFWDYILNKRYRGWEWSMEKLSYVVTILYFLLILIWDIGCHEERDYFQHIVNWRLPFLMMGIVGLLGVGPKMQIRWIGWVFIVMSMVIFIVPIFLVGPSFILNAPDKLMALNYAHIRYVNVHMTYNMYRNMAFVFALYIAYEHNHRFGERVLAAIAAILIFSTLMLSIGRTGLATSVLILCLVVCHYLWRKMGKKVRWAMLVIIPLLGTLLVGAQLIKKSEHKDVNLMRDPRLVIWDVCGDVIKERPITGFGVVGARMSLVEHGLNSPEYRSSYYQTYIKTMRVAHPEWGDNIDLREMHPHNVFLGTWMEFGIVGELMWLLLLITPFVVFHEKRNYLFLACSLLIFIIQSFTESLGPHLNPMLWMLNLIVWHYCEDAPARCNKDENACATGSPLLHEIAG